jgi:hypothetical protein
MLAYVFWHRPFPHVDSTQYEEAIVRFQSELSRQPPPGFISAASFQIEPVPWLGGQPGYEDWCLLQGSWAMDALNAFAVAGQMQASHDPLAAQMGEGHGGLYTHVWGETPPSPQSTIHWLTRPRGIQWRSVLDGLRGDWPPANVWRRQMVLGPGPEFAVEIQGHSDLAVPPGWQARRVSRVRLPRNTPR